MWWIIFVVVQAVYVIHGFRQEKRQGLWSWSKFAFALAFAGLEVIIVTVPLTKVDIRGPHFLPVMCTAWGIALLNFIWFIIVCRRWRLPDGRTSLQAYNDVHDGK
jgi:hypothetical protein